MNNLAKEFFILEKKIHKINITSIREIEIPMGAYSLSAHS